MVTDECTANELRVSYARILVEVNVTQEMKKEVTIKDSEWKKMIQPIKYEQKPLFCEKCHKIGHKCKGDKPKPPTEDNHPNVIEIQSPKGTYMEKDTEGANAEWKKVNSSSKIKGRSKVQTGTPIVV